MGDMVYVPSSDNSNGVQKKSLTKSYLITPSPSIGSKRAFKHLTCPRLEDGLCGQVLLFLLKVAALELVRRFSRSKCPILWHAIQSFQFLIYPPFKWIQKWKPLKVLVKGIQVFSRPLTFLSVVTAFSDHCQTPKKISNSKDDISSSPATPTTAGTSETRIADDTFQSDYDRLHTQLCKELQEDGVIFPERISDMEIQNFYTAANGDYSSLKESLRKTIRWRESYNVLSSQELEMWSHLVFWHGRGVDLQPCLIIRLGLAFSSLAPRDRPCFVQAVVSQLEHGVLHLLNAEDPRITALVDCDGLASIRFPMQMMRSCSALLQDHYPNRLATLLVTRLPPSTIATAQTFIQNLKTTTQKKVQIWGETDRKTLSTFLQSVPLFLGGHCACGNCHEVLPSPQVVTGESSECKSNSGISDGELIRTRHLETMDVSYGSNCEQVLRTAVIGMLMLWIFLAFFIGLQDPDSFLTS